MKKLTSFILSILLVFLLSACSQDTSETEKSVDLRAQYSFYDVSVKQIISGMEITPAQADEVFIALVSAGLDGDIRSVYKNGSLENTYSYYWKGSAATNNILMDNGVVSQISSGNNILYPEPAPESEPAKDELETKNPEILKTVVLSLDSQIYENVLNSEKTTQLLQDGIALVSDGGGSLLELYDLAKVARETQSTLFANLLYLSDDNTKAYVDACQLYVSNSKTVAEKLMKYIDKQEMKYLSEAKEALESSDSYVLSVVAERMAYLSGQGISDEEISAILAPEPAT